MDDRLQAAIAIVRAEYPEARLFQIGIPGDEEVYLARKCAWNEYKRLIGAAISQVQRDEQQHQEQKHVEKKQQQIEQRPRRAARIG